MPPTLQNRRGNGLRPKRLQGPGRRGVELPLGKAAREKEEKIRWARSRSAATANIVCQGLDECRRGPRSH